MAHIYAILDVIDELEIEEERNNSRILRRTVRDLSNPFNIFETEFIKNFRLHKEAALYVINLLTPFIGEGLRQSRIPNHIRVLSMLHFFAVGSYQRSIGNNLMVNMSQPMVSRAIRQISNILVRQFTKRWIKFPRNDQQKTDLKNSFLVNHHMREIIGIVDGTHVAIVKPADEENEHIYINRKGYHSINVQIICDAKARIISCFPRYPGNSHDSHIWRNSIAGRTMRANYENGDESSRILGDSGYSCLPWLLTPLVRPTTEQEIRFNNTLKRVRSGVERCIGILKGRFRCLLKDRTLHYSPPAAARIIMACAILHNIAIHFNVPDPEPVWDEIDLEVPEVQDDPRADVMWRQRGQNARQMYINQYY